MLSIPMQYMSIPGAQVDLSRSQNGELKSMSEMKRQKEDGSSQCSDLTMQVRILILGYLEWL